MVKKTFCDSRSAIDHLPGAIVVGMQGLVVYKVSKTFLDPQAGSLPLHHDSPGKEKEDEVQTDQRTEGCKTQR